MARNCIKGCGNVIEKPHCASKNCPWLVCIKCKVVFDPNNITREFPWRER